MADEKVLVTRAKRVAFMNTAEAEGPEKYERMTGFTTLTTSKNPTEYARQYVDEESERTDVTGYAPAIEYSFDRYTGNTVHEKVCKIHDGELIGTAAQVDIVVVDLFKKSSTGDKYYATKRTYSVIPDGDGDGYDALVYSGSFKSASEIEEGYATFEGEDFTVATYAKGDYNEA